MVQFNPLEENKMMITSFVQEVFNKHDLTVVDKYYGPNLIHHNPIAGKGRQGFKEFLTQFLLAFPDIHATIEHVIAENNMVCMFLNWTGTHKGKFLGMPATNIPIDIRSADLFRIDDTNHTIAEHWFIVDSINLLKQIGMIKFSDDQMQKNKER